MSFSMPSTIWNSLLGGGDEAGFAMAKPLQKTRSLGFHHPPQIDCKSCSSGIARLQVASLSGIFSSWIVAERNVCATAIAQRLPS